MSEYYFTSESVSSGHPDKLCDAVSDAILDLYLSHDPYARVACETLATTNFMVIAGEIRSTATISNEQIEQTAREVVRDIGYEQDGFNWRTFELDIRLHAQSADIAQGVDAESNGQQEEGAGDQGLMFGYACNETPELMPAPIYYAHAILQEINKIREPDPDNPDAPCILGPDAKSQVTYVYENGVPVRIDTVLVSTQHVETATREEVEFLVKLAIKRALPYRTNLDEVRIIVNPTGKFVVGGPDGDTGLTGRKIIVDTYGGAAPHGGGAFSGKDPTKVDRSAAYAARYLAKNIVQAGITHACTIQLAYAIGVAEPVSIAVDFHDPELNLKSDRFAQGLRKLVKLTPRGIIDRFDLRRPIYRDTSAYGHFGRPFNKYHKTFPWERTDIAGDVKDLFLSL